MRTNRKFSTHVGMNPDLAGHVFGFFVLDMFDSEGMIKHRGGHDLNPCCVMTPSVSLCPPFFNIKRLSLNRKNPKNAPFKVLIYYNKQVALDVAEKPSFNPPYEFKQIRLGLKDPLYFDPSSFDISLYEECKKDYERYKLALLSG